MYDIGDVIRITQKSLYGGEEQVNVFFYQVRTIGVGVSYADILDTFDGFVSVAHANVAHAGTNIFQLDALNITNGVDIGALSTDIDGTIGGEGMPTFVAWGFKLTRTDTSTRNGSKRFGGVSESSVLNGNAEASIVPSLNALATVLQNDLVVAGDASETRLVPVIVGRTPTGEYDLARINIVQSAAYRKVTSQVSRKI